MLLAGSALHCFALPCFVLALFGLASIWIALHCFALHCLRAKPSRAVWLLSRVCVPPPTPGRLTQNSVCLSSPPGYSGYVEVNTPTPHTHTHPPSRAPGEVWLKRRFYFLRLASKTPPHPLRPPQNSPGESTSARL